MNALATAFYDALAEHRFSGTLLRGAADRLLLLNVARICKGRTVHLFCDDGAQLAYLEPGSMGLECDGALVDRCHRKKLNVRQYDPRDDDLTLRDLPSGYFSTLLIGESLQNFTDPVTCSRALTEAATRLGITRILIRCSRDFDRGIFTGSEKHFFPECTVQRKSFFPFPLPWGSRDAERECLLVADLFS